MHIRHTFKNIKSPLLYISNSSIDHTHSTYLHSHPNLEIVLITSGKGKISSYKGNIDIKEGDLVIINQNAEHCEISDKLTYLSLGISNLSINDKKTYKKNMILLSLDKEEYINYKSILSSIFNESSNDDASNELIDNYYEILLIKLKRLLTVNEFKDNESELISNIKEIINNYYSSDIKLDDIAKRLSISVPTLCHEFKKQCHMTIMEYKINKQIEEACNLIKISDMPISQVAFLVGFNDPSYFIKTFKNKINMTPKSYREQFKENQ